MARYTDPNFVAIRKQAYNDAYAKFIRDLPEAEGLDVGHLVTAHAYAAMKADEAEDRARVIAPDERRKCDRCNGSGIYGWGAFVNGKPTHSGPCYRCAGKGYQTQEDSHRNWGYDNFAPIYER